MLPFSWEKGLGDEGQNLYDAPRVNGLGGRGGWLAAAALAAVVVGCSPRVAARLGGSAAHAPVAAVAPNSVLRAPASAPLAANAQPTDLPTTLPTEVPTEVPTETPILATETPAPLPGVLPALPTAPLVRSLPILHLDPVKPLRPVIVQIDNAIDARPPLHLSEADIVYEYVAEGGVTRFSALFTKEDVGFVGPLRSARFLSLEITRQFDALLLYHGASIGVQQRIYNGGIYYVSFARADTFLIETRLTTRAVPHNSVTTLPLVRAYAFARGVPPQVDSWPNFPRGLAPQLSPGTPTPQFSVWFAGPGGGGSLPYRADFSYDPERQRYLRAQGGVPHVDGATGQPISAETVVVQVVPVVVTDVVEDVLGSRSLDYEMLGEGVAYFMRDGLRWEGRWQRSDSYQPTTYTGPYGLPFTFGSGPIWIAVVGPDTPLTWGK